MVPFTLKVLAQFGLCSKCSQKLDEGSHARKTFATARMLGFSLKFLYMAKLRNLGGKMHVL